MSATREVLQGSASAERSADEYRVDVKPGIDTMMKLTLTFDDKKTGLAPRRRFLLQREEPFDLRIRRRGDDFGHYSACSLFSFLRTFSGRICGKKSTSWIVV